MNDERPLIISAAIGMPLSTLLPLVRSIQMNICSADVIFLRHPKDEPLPSEWGTEDVSFTSYTDIRMAVQSKISRTPAWRYVARLFGYAIGRMGRFSEIVLPMILHPMLGRYFYASKLLREVNDRRFIALIDSRDVVFQSDPFDGLNRVALLVAEEDTSVAENGATRSWITQLSRCLDTVLEDILPKPVICAGVTLGTAAIMRKYLKAFTHSAMLGGGVIGATAGFDQGLHNIILRRGSIPEVDILPVGNTLITHLCGNWAELFDLDLNRGVIGKADHKTASIVHFYDRKVQLVSYYSKRFAVMCQPHPAADVIAKTERPISVKACESERI